MARILRFRRDGNDNQGEIDSLEVWGYVLPRLDFQLPEFISREIDGIIRKIWNSGNGDIEFQDCVDALEALQEKDILIPYARREKIVSLIFEYLEKQGYILPLE